MSEMSETIVVTVHINRPDWLDTWAPDASVGSLERRDAYAALEAARLRLAERTGADIHIVWHNQTGVELDTEFGTFEDEGSYRYLRDELAQWPSSSEIADLMDSYVAQR